MKANADCKLWNYNMLIDQSISCKICQLFGRILYAAHSIVIPPSNFFFRVDLPSSLYSAPSIFAAFRNLVREIWFKKSGSKNLVREKWFCKLWFFFWFEKSGWLEKQVGLYYKSIFFSGLRKVVDQEKIWVCRTSFLEPVFYTFLEKWLQIKWSLGCLNQKEVFYRDGCLKFDFSKNRDTWCFADRITFNSCQWYQK